MTQTLPDTYRVAFDLNAGVDPMTFLPGTTTGGITTRLRAAFLAADVIRDGQQLTAAIDVEAGTVVVSIDGDVIEHGSITAIEPAVEVLDSNDELVLGTVTISRPEPDYWETLAEDLHRAAVRIATLAGSGLLKPASVNLNILVSVSPGDAEQTVPVVDALAAAFGGTAGPDEQTTYYHSARLQLGAVKFHPYTFVPDREESELERLRAEVAELRAAQGGA
ncbi:hypothetical protein ACGFIG_09485 [Micromonospora sp. NPDC049048]|uniref:hypothetical protein n=1 Tax=Micromonospora sp. NPDC049048 TaxID=3364263 RepID=UPI00371DBDD2